ncbi:MAG: preprotein translocase subunit SecG [Candidatus Cloacimonetes bacterium]|nr:preprotein translocase subunit SecG [Candidatus Cloacimonadota bacterium]
MDPLYIVLMVLHVIISVALILVILAQSSKGGALDGMLGGAATNVLGGQGASSFLKNATKILAVLFMLMCILLAFQIKKVKKTSGSKAIEQYKEEAVEEIPLEDIDDTEVLPLTEEPVETTPTE